ncbi:hypothetical protein Poli38472_010638 [Pythium oligandrum]|uniref:Ketosynthase family 3 (KS3) domain-containing protein n=1 Tax=Pythium oligandrum TaxID=41045 RepID=A0A8K1FB52_PYTOL|nr:hypothetical protein Poli38472_010638 [Pythium oligandrum]|eukprot:TMW55756.1 hypothetical protein Poli38472_010638 [Pythium oligandrum]
MAALHDTNTRPAHVGILAMEVYFPETYVEQSDLERFDGVPSGKYTIGLGQDQLGYTGDREDANSIALTCVTQLMEKYNIDPNEIGRLEVGTETLVDKSKSTKTVLMELFAASGNTDIEGVSTINACYGGTAALFNSLAWVESSAWDGRYAIAVASDIAVYAKGSARPTNGCGVIAMLIGPNAPLVVENRTRTTHASHIWDFFKPNPSTEFPTVDGQHSLACYMRALDDCYLRFCQKNERLSGSSAAFNVSSLDYAVFHSPYNKQVQKSISRLCFLDYRRQPLVEDDSTLTKWRDMPLEQTYTDRELDLTARKVSAEIYKKMAVPCHSVTKRLGNCYTASVYINLATIVHTQAAALANKRVLAFSYGSGSMASMFSIHARQCDEGSDPRFSLETMSKHLNLFARLEKRKQTSAEQFSYYMDLREKFHGKKSVTPVQPVSTITPGAYYLVDIDEKFRRRYARKPFDAPSNVSGSESTGVVAKSITNNGGVYVSGVSVILPGRDAPDNSGESALKALLNGDNCIETLTDAAVDAMLSRNIVQFKKSADKQSTEAMKVTTRDESIQVAAIMRPVDLTSAPYNVSTSMVEGMDESTRLGVAAGLDALKQAGLVSGQNGNWQLEDRVAASTGVIYATSYPSMSAAVAEASRFHTTDKASYELDRKYLFKILVLANAQLAQITGAKGPNTQTNGACAGMTQAIGLAHDWIRVGRCERVVVIASDVASNETLMPWIGSGFRVLGAASIASTPETAALPFDARRNGMLVGSGAAAVVLEASSALVKRPVVSPPVRLLATRYVNSAYHGAAIDVKHVTQELLAFFHEIENSYGITREQFAQHGVYYSHETFTNSSPKASCAYAEIEALRGALGTELLSQLTLANTKGFTGHPMGVSFEDVVAVEGLRSGRVPPVANFQVPDPHLGGPLRLSKGGEYPHKYAMRFAAGFGSQAAFTLYTVEDL